MKLYTRKKTQRKRTLLTTEQMDNVRANNAHDRSEKYKEVAHKVKVVTLVGGMIAIPVMYVTWCIVLVFVDIKSLPDTIKLGVTTLAGFLFGKFNIFKDD